MAAPQLSNTGRCDLYKNMKFQIRWDGRIVMAAYEMSGFTKSIEPVAHSKGDARHWDYEPITLERGVTHDPEFENWTNLFHNSESQASISLESFRKDIIIELLNEQGIVAKAYKIYRCWVSECRAMPKRDANSHVVAIEHLVLQHEGWELDLSCDADSDPSE